MLGELRSSAGTRVLAKWGILLPLKRALDRGEMVGLLTDEDARERQLFVPFLGTLAATTPSVAFLQRVTGATIVVASVNRVGREVTAQVSAALSRAIHAHPEQWLWGSRRFLTRPPGEQPGPDGLPPRAD